MVANGIYFIISEEGFGEVINIEETPFTTENIVAVRVTQPTIEENGNLMTDIPGTLLSGGVPKIIKQWEMR